jgi:FkbM family methyltransferase
MREVRIGNRSFVIRSLGGADEYEPVIQDGFGKDLWRFAEAHLKPDSVVLDVGANIGMTSCVFGQVAASVHAFEPNPDVYSLLEQNLTANQLTNVRPHRLAVSDKMGVMNFAGKSAFGRLTTEPSELKVEVRTLDEIVDDLRLTRLDLLKVDVEGFEPNVLRGGVRTLDRFNPTIVMEFNSWTLMAHGDINPMHFARDLLRDFGAISFLPGNADATEQITDPLGLVYTNILKHGCVSDLVLTRRRSSLAQASPALSVLAQSELVDGGGAPSKAPSSKSGKGRRRRASAQATAKLQLQLDAIHRSSSWRITAPLRALRKLWR